MTATKARTVRLAMVQMTCSENQKENTDKAIDRVRQAASQGANIVCLQELFNAPYPCQSEEHFRFEWAETIPGPTSQAMSDVARDCSVVVTGSIFERRAHGLYHNTAVVFDADGAQVGFYRKMHIPDDPLYYEKFYFTPGDTGFTVAKTRFGVLGVGVCWDQWYPEAARLFALKGAEILLYPTAIGWSVPDKPVFGKSQHEAWETMMRSHAIANGVFVGAANRVGVEDSIEFWGASFAFDPAGNLLHRASHSNEEMVVVDCNLNKINTQRTYWPFMRDRRIDAYSDLTKRWIDE
ncbi:MAG: carbon-nitrogen hydrolase [Planctomycetota bacterium]|nr:carbon-nitrogen hydrolase [Planctomycetota bacterium]